MANQAELTGSIILTPASMPLNTQLINEKPVKYHPIRCYEGNAKPQVPFWRMRNAMETGGDPEIEFYGPISEYLFMGDEVTPNMFKDQLYKLGNGGPVKLRVNSPGGDMIAASMIRAILTDYPGPVTAQIDGVAASAAVVVVMAAKQTQILDSAFIVIHDPTMSVVMAELDIQELTYIINSLKSAKDSIVNTYAEKTGLSNSRLEKMMSAVTWINAQEAVSMGFADSIVTGGNQKNAIKPNLTNSLRQLGNVPLPLLNHIDRLTEEEHRAIRRLRGEAKFYSGGK